ncbi:hypothetical protein [Vibrio campbellii]|uniref:hypothetical protein n=1 Tax=Vibrio campbellii TaxID=680 RepID=UPI002108A1B4|nr:hypothetical protein [Vibrio campbellii]UTZ44496.1 hypothetical protein HB764_24145 [Vibrio campbellii]
MPIREEYYVLSNDYSKVNFVVNMEDEHGFSLLMDKAIPTSMHVNFECISLKSFSSIDATFDISVNTEILFDLDFLEVLSKLTLYRNSLVPAKIKDKEFVYLHCYNIIDIEDEVKGFNFELLSEIPIEERFVFKPSYGAIVVFFHKSIIDKINSVKSFSYAKYQKVSDWSVEWEMS